MSRNTFLLLWHHFLVGVPHSSCLLFLIFFMFKARKQMKMKEKYKKGEKMKRNVMYNMVENTEEWKLERWDVRKCWSIFCSLTLANIFHLPKVWTKISVWYEIEAKKAVFFFCVRKKCKVFSVKVDIRPTSICCLVSLYLGSNTQQTCATFKSRHVSC